ncbi:integrase catalytic domain-containing protein [Trichonephila clavipes]|nr:integrase catalytic domain-containing protein [Trichonephila clavipes]
MERLRVYPASYSKYPCPSTRNRKRQNYYPWICRRLNSSLWCCTICSIDLRKGCIYKTLVQQIPCCTGETNHYPSFGIVCLCVIVTAPGKGFTFLDATYTVNNAMDCNIVLAWIRRSPEQLKTFIGNRIKIIQRLTQNCQWNHVSSNENPADLLSRGLNASDISSKQLWWHGPDFLREELEANPVDFERITSDSDYLKELKPANVLLTSCKFSLIDDLSKRSNNYTKLLHILSYIFRFLHNSRNPSVKRSGQLDYSEVNEAELCLIKNLQACAFQEEIEFLAKSSCNSKKKKSKLFSLNPFLDGNQILRGEEIVYRHCRVVFGVSSSPFLLAAVLAHLLENVPEDDTQLGSKLKLSFYVDNCVIGVNDIAQQEEFILRSKEILSRGCFNLRNWESNVESKQISKSTGKTKLLGIIWDLDKGILKCKIDFESLSGETKITKRLILATVQIFFYPIGMLCSVTLTPKILLQNTWKLKLSWNSSLPEEIVKPFFKWWNEIKILSDVEIPRYFEINDSPQIHVFVDACKEACATFIFFRSNTSQGVKVALVRAKARVSPLKQVTIPRLELMVCCIDARLTHLVQESLNIAEMETVFWSDSILALYWLREKRGWSVFVSNRIKEIKNLFPNSEWRHVPGKINPADLISQRCSPSHLVESHWWDGPLWLV